MPPRLRTLFRLMIIAILALCLIAVLLGRRTARRVRSPRLESRTPSIPRYRGLNLQQPHMFDDPPIVLDQTTGEIVLCKITGATNFAVLGCSPWRDTAGQYHLIIPFANRADAAANASGRTLGIARCSYPRGVILERLVFAPTDPWPYGPIGWFPDRTDRIAFTASDGRLYRYVLSSHEGSAPVLIRPRAIEWGCDPPTLAKTFYFRDLFWPSEPSIDGRLLVSLGGLEDSSPLRLCCLELSPDGETILDAQLVIDAESGLARRPEFEERLPSVGMAQDGTLALAYLLQPRGQPTYELWITSIIVDNDDGKKRVHAPPGTRLGGGCLPVAPIISADGKWVYVRLGDARTTSRVHRFAVKP